MFTIEMYNQDSKTKFAFLTNSNGLGDLKTKNKFELQELLDRQNNLLSNKSLINKLKDNGEKIKSVRDAIAKELEVREKLTKISPVQESIDSTECEWRKSNKNVQDKQNKFIETDESNVLKILSDNGLVSTVAKNKTHIKRLIDKEKDNHFSFKPHNAIVAEKIKNVIPEAHTELKPTTSVKSIDLQASLNLLSEQMSALKLLGNTVRRKRAAECIEDRLNESVGEIHESDTENDGETEASIKVNVNINP